LSEGAAVTYRNLVLPTTISSLDHPAWEWLNKRSGRIAGMNLELRLGALDNEHYHMDDSTDEDFTDDEDTQHADHDVPYWMQPLQTLSGIPGVQLRLEWGGGIDDLNHPFISQLLKQHGQLISHPIMKVKVSNDRLRLRDFSKAIAPCQNLDLTIRHSRSQVVDLADLHPVAESLQYLRCQPTGLFIDYSELGSLRGVSSLSSMSQLTALRLDCEDVLSEEPWEVLTNLTGLQQLHLRLRASGDPSPLSALTGLSSLHILSLWDLEADDPTPFSFSSLQPLSTLQQLEVLQLGGHACAATSLQGLAGLSNLEVLQLELARCGRLRTMEDISPGVKKLTIDAAPDLISLAGIQGCTSMEKLNLSNCGVSSLQPLQGLSKLEELRVCACPIANLEGLSNRSLQSLHLSSCTLLSDLAGFEHLSSVKRLEMGSCGVTSLQPLSQLGEGLQSLWVFGCKGVQDEILELPHVQPTAFVVVDGTKVVREVVQAGRGRVAMHDGGFRVKRRSSF
jgi:hypothetical protein